MTRALFTQLQILGSAVLVISVVTGAWIAQEMVLASSHRSFCTRVEESYYKRETPEFQLNSALCSRPLGVRAGWLTASQIVAALNRRAEIYGISHLQVHAPEEDRSVWLNQGFETGVRASWIEDAMIIHSVVPSSPAYHAGLRRGDEIISINGQPIGGSLEAKITGGRFTLRRLSPEGFGLDEFEAWVDVQEVREDFAPKLSTLIGRRDTAVLELKSFLPQYFAAESWREVSKSMMGHRGLIIDLRGNRGGSFPAMLRALSPFRCNQPRIGELRTASRNDEQKTSVLPDDLSDQAQKQALMSARVTRLETFGSDYGCFQGSVAVLIDSETASVAEIFASALQHRPGSWTGGQSSAGQMVMAQWFALPALGWTRFSVPIAGFWNESDIELEGRGVFPDETLFSELQASREGRDLWLERAAEALDQF